jgi:hypothetical protein
MEKGGMADESQLIYWYAPKVNRLVRFDYNSNHEGLVDRSWRDQWSTNPPPRRLKVGRAAADRSSHEM